jgi:N-acyl-D-amino-acid deacylase
MLARLTDASERSRIAAETKSSLEWRWSDIYISAVGSPRNQAAVGQNLAALGELRGCEPVDVMIDLLVEERGAVNMLCFNQSEENLRQTLTHPLSVVISDGFYVKGRPHPRLHGTFPLFLGTFCRERHWLTLPEAVHKVTDGPAQRFGIRNRGRLAPGYFADVTVFDPATIDSPATYDAPERAPTGIRHVIRNGKLQSGDALR